MHLNLTLRGWKLHMLFAAFAPSLQLRLLHTPYVEMQWIDQQYKIGVKPSSTAWNLCFVFRFLRLEMDWIQNILKMVAWGVKTNEENSTYPLSEAAAGERQGLRTGRLLLLLQRLFFIDKSRTPSVGTEYNKQLDKHTSRLGGRDRCARGWTTVTLIAGQSRRLLDGEVEGSILHGHEELAEDGVVAAAGPRGGGGAGRRRGPWVRGGVGQALIGAAVLRGAAFWGIFSGELSDHSLKDFPSHYRNVRVGEIRHICQNKRV